MTGFFNFKKFFAWFSIFSLVLQIGSGVLLYQPAFAEEEATPTPEQTETVVETPTPEPTVTETLPVEPTPTIEVIPTETPTEPLADPTLAVVEPEQEPTVPEEGLNLDPSGTDQASAQLKPEITTDKSDYAPEETVTISGQNFPANTVLLIKVTRPDGSVVKGDGSFEPGSDEVTTDAEGKFTYSYKLDGILGEYKVEIFQGETVLATTTFTDSRTINWVTLNGGSNVTVSPGATITAAINVTVSGLLYNDWKSTKYQIEGESEQCVNTPDHTGKGTWTESFTITAPSNPGTYDVSFRAFKNDSCSSGESGKFTLRDGITVTREVIPNPSLPRSCGLDMVLVLDSSDSMSEADITTVENAAKTLVNTLMPATPTQIGVIDFDTNVVNFLNPTTVKQDVLDAIDDIGHTWKTEYTNWEAALKKADDMVGAGGLVVIITDGNPTESDGPLSDLEDAIVAANALKTGGTRILAIGINSSGSSGGLDLPNLIAISGPIVSPPAAVTAGTDVITGDISGLAGILADLVTALCGGTITVNKYIDDLQHPAGAGWTFDIAGTSKTTDSNGQTEAVTVQPGTGHSVTETGLLPGYQFVSAVCHNQAGALEGSAITNGVGGIDVSNQDIISCDFINTAQRCGDGVKNGSEQCDGTSGVIPGQNFCTYQCNLVPIYDGLHSCPANTVPVQVGGPYDVYGNDADGISVPVTSGGKYLFEAMGTFIPTGAPGYLSDAGYTWVDGLLSSLYGIHGTPPDYAAHALLANLGSGVGVVDWGEHNSDHIYTKYYQPATDNVQFVIGDRYGDWFDTPYQNQTGMSDNSGNLTLNVYECQQTGSITIRKDSIPNHEQDFNFTRDFGGSFSLDDDSNATLPNSITFNNLTPGNYSVTEENSNWQLTNINCTGGQTSRNERTININLSPGDNASCTFVNVNGIIVSYKYNDLDNSGHFDTGEPRLDGWLISLYDSSWNLLKSMLTGDDTTEAGNVEPGHFTFKFLIPGTYYVCETLQNGWVQTEPTTGPIRDGIHCRQVNLTAGQLKYGIPFGNLGLGEIKACKYDDYDGDGEKDEGEPGIVGVTMTLEKSGEGWQPVAFGDTGEDGCYTFDNLMLGHYRVSEDLGDLPGYNPTSPSSVETDIVASGALVSVDFFNELQPITLTITKTNNITIPMAPGGTVTYTLVVTNTSDIIAHNVSVRDVLPSGFSYVALSTTGAGEPAISGQMLTWSLGDLNPDAVVTIIYQATTDTGLETGDYPNVAVAWGYNRVVEHPDREVTYTDFADSWVSLIVGIGYGASIGGTTITSVLGAATSAVLGAATGSETYWLILAILMVLVGLALKNMDKLKKFRFEKIKKWFKVLIILLPILASLVWSRPVFAANLTAFITDLPEYKTTSTFKLYYTALQIDGKPISAQFYYRKEGDVWRVVGGPLSGETSWVETSGTEIGSEGKYYFKIVASSEGETIEDETSTMVDWTAPGGPGEYSKERINSNTYRLKWRTPNNDDFSRVLVYRSKEQNFNADSGTLVVEVGGAKDTLVTWENTGLEIGKDYFYALRSVDKAGNASGLAGDGGTISYVEVSPTPAPGVAGAGEMVALPKEEEGEILGGATEAPTPTEAPAAPSVLGGVTEAASRFGTGAILAGLGAIMILAVLVYSFRKRSS